MTGDRNLNENIVGLRMIMIPKDRKYSEKVKLSGEVYEIIGENQINQTSLPQDLK